MRRGLLFVCTIAMVFCFASIAMAEVQNVKVGGDIRIRGQYDVDKAADDYGSIEQRTNVFVEADLTDNVSTFVQFRAEGFWGDAAVTEKDAVAAVPATATTAAVAAVPAVFRINRKNLDVNLDEAYVVMREAWYSPLTLKTGRQRILLGRGFHYDNHSDALLNDAIKATLDYAPWEITAFFAKEHETGEIKDDLDVYVGNVKYLLEDVASGGEIEGYVIAAFDDSSLKREPILFGIRGDIAVNQDCTLWGELVYEDGKAGEAELEAWAAQIGGSYVFDHDWKPVASLEYTYGSGDANDGEETYAPVDREYKYYGLLFSPEISNIHVINANLVVQPWTNVTLTAGYFYYMQADEIAMIMGDLDQDEGGVAVPTNGTDDSLGHEFDLIAAYDYTDDVALQGYAAIFFPGDAYDGTTLDDDTAFEIRGEIIVNF